MIRFDRLIVVRIRTDLIDIETRKLTDLTDPVRSSISPLEFLLSIHRGQQLRRTGKGPKVLLTGRTAVVSSARHLCRDMYTNEAATRKPDHLPLTLTYNQMISEQTS